jgi:type IV secretory pathway VirB10-like protein
MPEENIIPGDGEPEYEMTPEEATGLGGGGTPGVFNRKKLMIFICITLAASVMLGVIFNTVRTSKKPGPAAGDEFASSRSNASFLASLRDSALRENSRRADAGTGQAEGAGQAADEGPLLPPVSFDRPREDGPARVPPATAGQPPPQPPQPSGYPPAPQQAQPDSHYRSSLVPQVQGSLFSRNAPAQQGGGNSPQQSPTAYDDYLNQLNSRVPAYQPSGAQAQNNQQSNQQGNQNFYESSSPSGAVYEGRFLGENALWLGTMIPGILETAINTDLPGHVLARVTQNIYDSQTGRHLLVPQGTLLVARYNNSVSYAQSRVQIIWDTLIRPDGFQIDFEGANGVDRAGMAGQEAAYHENWFEYVKAAGIISLFSIANARFVETADKYSTSTETSSNIAQANQQFFNQLGGSLISRAMGVQPTLTVENGTLINIMLNKTLYLPSVTGFAPAKKYILE